MSTVSASDWIKGISLSILASIIGGASKLAIRKSWLQQQEHARRRRRRDQPFSTRVHGPEMTNNSYHAIEEDQEPSSYLIEGGGSGAMDTTDHEHEDSPSAFHDEVVDDQARNTITMIAWCLRGSGMIGMTFLNPACSVMAMNYASPSILAPFSGLTLVWIVLLSQPLIHEKPTVRQVIAASLIILGEVLVAIFGDHTNEEEMTIAKITESYKEVPFLIYVVATVIWMCFLMLWMKYSTNPTLKRFAWGVAGGSITGFQNFLKDTLTLFKVRQEDEHLPWYTALLCSTVLF